VISACPRFSTISVPPGIAADSGNARRTSPRVVLLDHFGATS
jgi:hypothetical protein